jgi:hypothetical protein
MARSHRRAIPTRDELPDTSLAWMHTTRDRSAAARPWRNVAKPSWSGQTQPRRFDEVLQLQPRTLLYSTGRETETPAFEYKAELHSPACRCRLLAASQAILTTPMANLSMLSNRRDFSKPQARH